MKFPIPWLGYTDFTLKKPDTSTILNVAEKSESGNQFASMLAWLEGSIDTINGEKPVNLKKIPLVNAEVVSKEAFMLYRLPTLVEGIYPCPRSGCGHINKHIDGEDCDNRDDIAYLKVNYSETEPVYELVLSEGNEIEIAITRDGKSTVVAIIKKMMFRPPTLDDLLKLESDQTLKTSIRRMKKLYLMCLVDGEAITTDGDTFSEIKSKYGYDLLNFPDFRDFDRLTTLFRQYGFDHLISIVCESCGKEYQRAVDFTGFFVSALLSQSQRTRA